MNPKLNETLADTMDPKLKKNSNKERKYYTI